MMKMKKVRENLINEAYGYEKSIKYVNDAAIKIAENLRDNDIDIETGKQIIDVVEKAKKELMTLMYEHLEIIKEVEKFNPNDTAELLHIDGNPVIAIFQI